MKRGLDWYKRDPIAFLDAVQGMGSETIGAYAVLLDLVYARAGQTPRDDRHLAGILGCSLRKATALTDRLIEAGKLSLEDGFITNSRAKSEAKSRRNLSETRAKSGRKGGEKSGASRKNKDLDEASASSKTEAEKEKEKRKREPNGSPKKDLFDGVSEDPPPPKRTAPFRPKFPEDLGIDPDLERDYFQHRKSIKVPITTPTALNGIVRGLRDYQARGCDPNQGLRTAIERGWRGFDAKWFDNLGSSSQQRPAQPLSAEQAANERFIQRRIANLGGPL